MLKSRKGQEGFTLIELLVVVLIIGILAAIAIPAFLGQKKGAQDANAKSLLRNAAIAMESSYADTQDFGADTAAAITAVKTVEPNIDFSATAQDAKLNQVMVLAGNIGGATTDPMNAYLLTTKSQSGAFFTYLRDNTAKVAKCKSTGSTAVPAAVAAAVPGTGTGETCAGASTW